MKLQVARGYRADRLGYVRKGKKLLKREKKRLKSVKKEINGISPVGHSKHDLLQNRKYFELLREAVHLFEDAVFRANEAGEELKGKDAEALRALAGKAIIKLGGVAEPGHLSLKDYGHHLHGPYLGVSDEGSAAHIIRRAALKSPKAQVLGGGSPIQIGVAHDAERLAAVGEVAVGPEEYRDIILECRGSILTSTNVGTRLNLRYYKIRPIIRVSAGSLEKTVEGASQEAKKLVEPFWHTPDGMPRPVTLFAFFGRGTRFLLRRDVLKALRRILSKGDFCDPRFHKLGILADVGIGRNSLNVAMENIDLAKEAGIKEVAIQGMVRGEAEDKISMPGLLNYFSPKQLTHLLNYAAKNKIKISPKNLVDPDTVARNVWSSLQAARNMGLELGKYGLFPLTLGESDEVMGLIQRWFSDWTAAPVFYVDFPHVGKKEVFTEKNIVKGAKKWLDIVARHKIPVVLFDTADKDKGRKLLKYSPNDRLGIFARKQIGEIDSYANKKGIRSLWAGGITVSQALEFGKLGVFGIYVTSAAAASRPVTKRYKRDPMITAEKEPTFEGVSRVKLLLEAGFLIRCLQEYGLGEKASNLDNKAKEFVKLVVRTKKYDQQESLERELPSLAENAWKIHYKRSSTSN